MVIKQTQPFSVQTSNNFGLSKFGHNSSTNRARELFEPADNT